MVKSKGFAGMFLKESVQVDLQEAYFSDGVKNLIKNGAKNNWLRGFGSYRNAQGLRLKSTANENIAFLEGDVSFPEGSIGSVGYGKSTFGTLARIVDGLREDHGQDHNFRYNTVEDLNFDEQVMFDQNEIDSVKNPKYKGVRIFSEIKHLSGDKYHVKFGREMIKV